MAGEAGGQNIGGGGGGGGEGSDNRTGEERKVTFQDDEQNVANDRGVNRSVYPDSDSEAESGNTRDAESDENGQDGGNQTEDEADGSADEENTDAEAEAEGTDAEAEVRLEQEEAEREAALEREEKEKEARNHLQCCKLVHGTGSCAMHGYSPACRLQYESFSVLRC
jgi:hypothetical protein